MISSKADSDLIPKTISDFREKQYWDTFFEERNAQTFEWYGDWSELKRVVPRYVSSDRPVLVVGCGNSSLSENLLDDVGCKDILSVDYSDKVIAEMRQKAEKAGKSETLRFEKMDLRDMSRLSDGHFQTVVDKACLDAIFTDASKKVKDDVTTIVREMCRVLAAGGRYVCVTLAQDHVLEFLLTHFSFGWRAHVHWIATDSPLPSFLFCFAKNKAARAKARTTWKLHFHDDVIAAGSDKSFIRALLETGAASSKASSIENVRSSVIHMQRTVYMRRALKELRPRDGIRFNTSLWSSSKLPNAPKYEIAVIDRPDGGKVNGSQCAVLLVPSDRFREWLFADQEGQKKLCLDAGFARLIIVRLHPAHAPFDITGKVQEELSPLVLPLAPRCVEETGEKIVFISIGPSEDESTRSRILETESAMNGRVVVDQSVVDTDESMMTRQLIFLNSPQHVQSEIRLRMRQDTAAKKKKRGSRKKRGGKKSRRKEQSKLTPVFDHSTLSFDIHRAMIASLALLPDIHMSVQSSSTGAASTSTRVLVIGLGGGVLPMFLHRQWPQWSRVDAVEIDSVVVDVARTVFGFSPSKASSKSQSGTLAVHVCDGVKYVDVVSKRVKASQDDRASASSKTSDLAMALTTMGLSDSDFGVGDAAAYDAIFIDANASDSSLAMAFPPPAFLTQSFMVALRDALRPGGIAVLNVCSRSPRAYASFLVQFRSVFTTKGAEKMSDLDTSSRLAALDSATDGCVLDLSMDDGNAKSVNRLVVATKPSESLRRVLTKFPSPSSATRALQNGEGKWDSEMESSVERHLTRWFFNEKKE